MQRLQRPGKALLGIKWHLEQGKPFWHWVVFVCRSEDAFVLDSKKGLPSNIRRDFGRMKPKWFIEVIESSEPRSVMPIRWKARHRIVVRYRDTEMKYQKIDESCAQDVARLAVCLTNEIIERTGTKHFDVDASLAVDLCEKFVRQGQYHVIAAFEDDTIVGFGALCESHSLYAEGTFGIIQEFYVLPEYRSRNIGATLIREFVEFARQKNWQRLELCTPPVPEFERTVTFYQANGFEITGGYKMKYMLG